MESALIFQSLKKSLADSNKIFINEKVAHIADFKAPPAAEAGGAFYRI